LLFFFLFSAQPGLLSGAAIAALLLTLFSGCSLLFTQQLVVFFVSFELLLLGALFLLKFTSKSERVDEAVAEMAFWTLLGSLGLLAGFLPLFVQGCATFGDLHPGQVSPLFVGLLCCGFGVKVPLWPCFSWLLRAHVEASTEYSIMLSGVILKFGLFGLFRVLSVLGGGVVGYVVAALALIGLLEASVRILGQRDLKRVVALTTVVELNWAAFSLALGGAVFEHVALFVCLAHSVTTATEFYLVDCISRRFGSRDLALVSGLAHATPQLFAVSVLTFLVTVGFPGTSIFLCKLYFFTALLNLAVGPWFCLCLVFFF
jgi:NADH-quinone oxidoreductase subunit M